MLLVLHTVFVLMNLSKISLDRPDLIILQITSLRFQKLFTALYMLLFITIFVKNIQEVKQ